MEEKEAIKRDASTDLKLHKQACEEIRTMMANIKKMKESGKKEVPKIFYEQSKL